MLNTKGAKWASDYKMILNNCKNVLEETNVFIQRHSSLAPNSGSNVASRLWHSYQVGSADLDDIRGKLTFYTSTIGIFWTALELQL